MSGAAGILTGVAGIIFAVAVLLWVWQRRGGSALLKAGPLEARFDSLERELARVHGTATVAAVNARQANAAVNNVAPGVPSLVDRVGRIERVLCQLCRHVGVDPEA